MKKIFFTAAMFALLGSSAYAQDVYKVEMLSNNDLSGDARYVGMGGAMSALGANLSAMSVNPASAGLYRGGDIALTMGVPFQTNAKEFYGKGAANLSFDQIGFAYALRTGSPSVPFFTVGFNYSRNNNFKRYIGFDPVATKGGMSQSWQMRDLAADSKNRWLDLGYDADRQLTTPLACLGYDTQMIDVVLDDNGKIADYIPSEAADYDYHRVNWGGVDKYDFNLALNISDRVYLGVDFGAYNVNYNSILEYREGLIDPNGGNQIYYMQQAESISGSGFDAKFGVIVRPIEDSPFRLGFAFHTPRWYRLCASSTLYMRSPYEWIDNKGKVYDYTEADVDVAPYNYNITTPWRINVSAATTVSNWLALDAEYEYAPYNSSKVSYPYGGRILSSTDGPMNDEIALCLKGVHTIKAGAEARIAKGWFARMGYNYVSSPFDSKSYLNFFNDSPSYFYNTSTDYVNLGDINRVTFGLGYRGKYFYADLSYQCQQQSGDVYAFHYNDADRLNADNDLKPVNFDLTRHNIQLTLGFKF